MGKQKEKWEQSLPVLGKKEFEKELDYLIFAKDKSQKLGIKNGKK
jgi:hypothetical protein